MLGPIGDGRSQDVLHVAGSVSARIRDVRDINAAFGLAAVLYTRVECIGPAERKITTIVISAASDDEGLPALRSEGYIISRWTSESGLNGRVGNYCRGDGDFLDSSPNTTVWAWVVDGVFHVAWAGCAWNP